MLSFKHELLVDLFRNEGQLAVELLRTCAGLAVDHARVKVESIDLSQVTSTEYRADAVVVLLGHGEQAVAGLIIEVQLQSDRDKQLTWPAYVANLRAKLGCPAVLIVVAPAPAVAAWARQPIELGHPGFRLAPLVVSFDDVPYVRDSVDARRLPELAVLSVLAHPELEIAQAALDAIEPLPEDRKRLYLDVILSALPDAVRHALEARMQRYEYQSEFARKYYGQGREEGRQEGLRAAVVALARTKLGQLSNADLAAIEAVSDQQTLSELVTSLGRHAPPPEPASPCNARSADNRVRSTITRHDSFVARRARRCSG